MITKKNNRLPVIFMSNEGPFGYMSWWCWAKWTLILGLVSIVYLFTIIKSPLFHADLFINIDLGRIFLNPDTDWAITWMTGPGQPVYLLNYIGIVFQEYFYQMFGLVGPVILTLAGALFAATILLKWLLLRDIPKNVAFILSLTFLLDPIFVQSYTIGRLDSWVIGLCLSACFLLRHSIKNLEINSSLPRNRVAIAGGIAAVSFFTWPSAIFLFPLIMLELIGLSRYYRLKNTSKKNSATVFGVFSFGGMITLILLLVFVYPGIFVQVNEIITTWQINLQNENVDSERVFYIRYFWSFIEIFRVLKFSPFILFLAFIGIIKSRDIGLCIACFIAALLMISTVVYIQRVLYLLPYFVILASYTFRIDSVNNPSRVKSAQTYALVISLIWAVSLSIGAYTVLSFEKMKDNEKELLYNASEAMIGVASASVLTPYEFYSFGRHKGWKMYSPYTALGSEKFSYVEMEAQLPLVDYAILGASSMTNDLANQLVQEGLLYRGDFVLYENPLPPSDGRTTNVRRLRNLYHIFRQPYGPYHLFSREDRVQASFLTD